MTDAIAGEPVPLTVRDPGSFRDPKGHVFVNGGDVLRTVTNAGAEDYRRARDSGLLADLEGRGWLVPTEEIDAKETQSFGAPVCHLLRHPRLPFISYPYEWSFGALKDAALLHLDILLACLERDISMSDASAYNVQFNGYRAQFIDILSFEPYTEGQPWYGYRQFCEQFLNPLLLTALWEVRHNSWYRGSLEGITAAELAPLVRWRHRLDLRVLSHVVLQARLQRRSLANPLKAGTAARKVTLSRSGLRAIWLQLRGWIAGMRPAGSSKTAWADYAVSNTYSDDEYQEKRAVVGAFCQRLRPKLVWDIGCNTGDYSVTALQCGAEYAVGFDADHSALDQAYARAKMERLSFVPLYQDLANPSPSQGWSEHERKGIQSRVGADAVLALALIHHLAIGRNVPLAEAVRWLVGLAPRGIIEFVPKSDPTVQIMLTVRKDIFDGYSEEAFANALTSCANVVGTKAISKTGRILYIFDRTQ